MAHVGFELRDSDVHKGAVDVLMGSPRAHGGRRA